MTPAECLRALDRAATPGKWSRRDIISRYTDIELAATVRNLLPLLADVVEAAQKERFMSEAYPSPELGDALDRLTAAVAEVEGKK